MKAMSIKWVVPIILFLITAGHSQLLPAWRALIVYTNSTDSAYGGSGVNMYEDYFASLIDGLNGVYEASQVDVRAQIAGVVWDKSYVNTCGLCSEEDLSTGPTGSLGRWENDSILNKYAADVVIIVNYVTDSSYGGAAFIRSEAQSLHFGGYWTRLPNNLWLFAHEMGHDFSNAGNADHCASGHRRTFDGSGIEIGGPAPDTNSFIVGTNIYGDSDYIADAIVESADRYAYSGFYTTMAYGSGGGTPSTYPCYPLYTNTHDGVTRTFKFDQQGVGWGIPGGNSWLPEWTGTYSNPNVSWLDDSTSTSYPTGGDTLLYINRLKYLDAGTVTFRDTTIYHRDFADTINTYADTIRNLRGIPSNITLTSSNSLGANGADSQWVYANFVATNSVNIRPGFKVGTGSSMSVYVGEEGGSLAKRGVIHSGNGAPQTNAEIENELKVEYNPTSQAIVLSLNSGSNSDIALTIFDLKGVRKEERTVHITNGSSVLEPLSVKEFSRGLYFVQAVVGTKKIQRQFVKW